MDMTYKVDRQGNMIMPVGLTPSERIAIKRILSDSRSLKLSRFHPGIDSFIEELASEARIAFIILHGYEPNHRAMREKLASLQGALKAAIDQLEGIFRMENEAGLEPDVIDITGKQIFKKFDLNPLIEGYKISLEYRGLYQLKDMIDERIQKITERGRGRFETPIVIILLIQLIAALFQKHFKQRVTYHRKSPFLKIVCEMLTAIKYLNRSEPYKNPSRVISKALEKPPISLKEIGEFRSKYKYSWLLIDLKAANHPPILS